MAMPPYNATPAPQRKRPWWAYVIALVLLGGCVLGAFTACLSSVDKAINAPAPAVTIVRTPPAAKPVPTAGKSAAAPKPHKFGEGTYSVPDEVKPGTYATTVPEDASIGCIYARLSRDGDPGSVILGGIGAINEPGASGRITIKQSDKGVQFTGVCKWAKVK